MLTRAAILREPNTKWTVEEIELDPPRAGEILVKASAAGLCHSDEHAFDGSMPVPLPIVGGHEGAGIVVDVGEGVTEFEPGDQVSASFVPSCGKCSWCAKGMQNLCDLGAQLMEPGMMAGGFRHHDADGNDLTPMLKVGTFSEHMIWGVDSAIKVEKWLPPIPVALVSCGVTSGYGAAVYRAEVKPGDTVVVVGIGGLGASALQGAKLAGAKHIVAIDPVEWKREQAMLFGATHTAPSMEEAVGLVSELTWGVNADSVILTPGRMTGDLIAPAQGLTSKGGTIVVTAVAPLEQMDVQLNLFMLAMLNQEMKGVLFGSTSPRREIPRLLAMYDAGQLMIDEMVTTTYSLDDINQGYQDMRDAKNIRGVITFD
jgi:S-(hydroxymethyl)glutathione dehydrogenase/alcohol dehydrogenase